MSLRSKAATIAAVLALTGSVQAQQTPTNSPAVYTHVAQMPTFPGGQTALLQTLGRTVQYPPEAQQQGVQGRVFVSFVIDAAGAVRDAKPVKSVHPLLDAKAVRAVQSLPAFIPGRQNGQPVAVAYTLPIQFRLPAEPATTTERDAQYPGGPEALAAYLAATPYPEAARVAQLEGRVYVQFEVDSIGRVGKVQVLPPVPAPQTKKKSTATAPDFSALRMAAEKHFAAMPAWQPALRKGTPITTRWTVPVDFALTPAGSRPLPYADQLPIFAGSTPNEPLQNTIARSIRYPAAALRSGFQGESLVYFEVSEQGRMEHVEIVRSSHPLLDAEAERAVKAQQITAPAQFQGRPVRVFCILPLKFVRI